MRTVKEIAKLTGISARTLHYYDEIGLFGPTAKSEAGYRLYDDKALETLQQILFFREFGIPLKEIRAVMENPDLDRNQILQTQRKMLVAKKERLERLIASIDDLLKGDSEMDYTVFDEAEIRAIYDGMVKNMNEEQKQVFLEHYGSMEAFEAHYLKSAASEQAQKNFAKIVEWYGSREAALAAAQNSRAPEVMTSYQRRLGAVQRKIAEKIGTDVNSFEVRELIGEYDFVARQLYQMEDVTKLMLELAGAYRDRQDVREGTDSVYGTGFASYLADAIEAFYGRQEELS